MLQQAGRVLQPAGAVARNMNIDRLDNRSEVCLGLSATFCVTVAVYFLAWPFFHVFGMPWVESWEGPPPNTTTTTSTSTTTTTTLYTTTVATTQATSTLPPAHPVPFTVFGEMKISVPADQEDAFKSDPKVEQGIKESLAEMAGQGVKAPSVEAQVEEGQDSNARFIVDDFQNAQSADAAVTSLTDADLSEASGTVKKKISAAGSNYDVQVIQIMAYSIEATDMHEVTFPAFDDRIKKKYGNEQDAFTALCGSGDTFTEEQLRGVATKLDPPFSDGESNYIFLGLDTNKDSKVDSDEYFSHMSSKEFTLVLPQTTPAPGVGNEAESQIVEEESFRNQAAAWAGSMREACNRWDLNDNSQVASDEFTMGVSMMSPSITDPEEASKQFTELDIDKNGHLSPDECVTANWFWEQMATAGSAPEICQAADANMDGKLSPDEFNHIGQMVEPALNTTSLEVVFVELDSNGDGFVECQGEFVPGDQHAEGVTLVQGTAVSPGQLEHYMGKPASTEGTSEVSLKFSPDVALPADEEVGAAVQPMLASAFEIELELPQNTVAWGTPVVIDADSAESKVRRIAIPWSVNVADGGAFHSLVQNKAEQVAAELAKKIGGAQGANAAWMSVATTNVYSEISLHYQEPEGSLPSGNILGQKFGDPPVGGASLDGSPPYIITERRRLREGAWLASLVAWRSINFIVA